MRNALRSILIIPGLFLILLLAGCGQSASPTAASTATRVPSQTSAPDPAVTQTPEAPPTPLTEITSTPAAPINPGEPQQPAPTEPPILASPAVDQPQTTPVATESTALSDCTDTAGFFDDVTIPDGTSFKQNIPFTKIWRIRNEGTCTWNSNYSLVFSGGSQMSAPLTNPMPSAAPGDVIDISVNMVSPSSGGEFTGLWEFQNPDGSRFGVTSGGGGKIWVKIGVSIYNDQGKIVAVGSDPVPAPTGEPVSTSSSGCNPERNSGYEQQILEKINSARSQNALPALTWNDQLAASAFAHSADMACQDFVDHAGSDGSTWYTRIKSQGYLYQYANENIYVGNPAFGGTADGAFSWWMNSQIHRDNILSTKVTEIGIGYAFNSNSSFGGYYTINFARP